MISVDFTASANHSVGMHGLRNRHYTANEWAQDVLQAVEEGKTVSERTVALARKQLGICEAVTIIEPLIKHIAITSAKVRVILHTRKWQRFGACQWIEAPVWFDVDRRDMAYRAEFAALAVRMGTPEVQRHSDGMIYRNVKAS